MIQNTLWMVAAATAGVLMEFAYRRYPTVTWVQFQIFCIPFGLLISYALLNSIRSHESILGTMLVWSLYTLCLRVILTLIIGEHVPVGTWAAVVLMGMARIVQALWR